MHINVRQKEEEKDERKHCEKRVKKNSFSNELLFKIIYEGVTTY